MKAIIACAHKMIRVIYKILSTGEHYDTKKALGLRQQARAILKNFFHLNYRRIL